MLVTKNSHKKQKQIELKPPFTICHLPIGQLSKVSNFGGRDRRQCCHFFKSLVWVWVWGTCVVVSTHKLWLNFFLPSLAKQILKIAIFRTRPVAEKCQD